MDTTVTKFAGVEEAETAESLLWAQMDPIDRLAIGFELLFRFASRESFSGHSLKDLVVKVPLIEQKTR